MSTLSNECFENEVSEVARKSLNELIKRKQDDDRYKRRILKTIILLLIWILAIVLYTSFSKKDIFHPFSIHVFQSVLSNPAIVLFVLGFVFTFLQLQRLIQKQIEASRDYEQLRIELIDRSEELWSEEEQWKNRHSLFSYMEQEYDINLYHK